MMLAFISTEGIDSFLKNLVTVTQSAEQALIVIATFLTTGVGGVLMAVKQIKKRIQAAEVDDEIASKMLKLSQLEEQIKKDQGLLTQLPVQKNPDHPVLVIQNDLAKEPVKTEAL